MKSYHEPDERCPRCGAALDWRHETWQCPRCRFKLGCCEGEPQRVLAKPDGAPHNPPVPRSV